MKLTICSFIIHPSVSNLSYSISSWSITLLFFSTVIFLATHTESILSQQINQMADICSCGLQVPQQKFCEHDFVFAGKRVNRNVTPFNTPNGVMVSELIPYMGQIYRIRLRYNFKGVFVNYSKRRVFVTIYVLRGPICGVSDSISMIRKKNYVLSGYQYKSLLVLTSCNWIQPLNSITSFQAIGLFSNLYQKYCDFSHKCQISVDYKSPTFFDQICKINQKYKDCYENYAICHWQSNNKCAISTNLTDLSNQNRLIHLPNSLLKNLKKEKQKFQQLSSTHFRYCVISKMYSFP